MKIDNVTSEIGSNYVNHHQNSAAAKLERYGAAEGVSGGNAGFKDKIRLPENYQAKRINLASRITPNEQKYFEQMYPMHKRQIQAYMEQSKEAVPVKGQFIDIRR